MGALLPSGQDGGPECAWWNIVAAAYPESRVRWRSVFGAYASGVGVNAIAPLRGGDVVAVALVKTRVEGASYTTLVALLLVAAPGRCAHLDGSAGVGVSGGVLPGLDVVHRLPAVDWLWALDHPRAALVIAAAAVAAGLIVGVWASRRIAAFRRRVAQAFTILRTPVRYLHGVVFGNCSTGCCASRLSSSSCGRSMLRRPSTMRCGCR